MHLYEIVKYRSIVAAGTYLCLTRRCPLFCDHCSTNSHPKASESPNHEDLIRYVTSFTKSIAPKILCLTGGEPLLLPRLVKDLCEKAHESNTNVDCATGLFFANMEISEDILEALKMIDHLGVSIDVFHEKQLGRKAIFNKLHEIRELGIDISISATGFGKDDQYLLDLIDSIRREFKDQVPIFVTSIENIGRARKWYSNIQKKDHMVTHSFMDFNGCKMTTWPVVTFDGTIVTCCNQEVVDGPHPSHLTLGHIKDTDWNLVRSKLLEDGIIRAIRLVGPKQIFKLSNQVNSCSGYCKTCMDLDNINGLNDLNDSVKPWMEKSGIKNMDNLIQYFNYYNDTYTIPEFTNLISLGLNPRN